MVQTPSRDPEPRTAAGRSTIERMVAFCADHAALVAGLGLVLGLAALAYAAASFAMSTNTDQLISKAPPWRQREAAFDRLFRPEGDPLVVVIDGATPELAERAAAEMTARLGARRDLFHDVRRPDAGPFFATEGLLFESPADVRASLDQTIAAQPFLGPLAADPSLRGLMSMLSMAARGVGSGDTTLAALDRPMSALADTLEAVRAGRPAFFSWRALIAGKPSAPRDFRQIVLATPLLDFSRLQAAADPSAFVRATARSLRFDATGGVRVRLTGSGPLEDEEFGTLAERAPLIASLALGAIVLMLWLATRSVRAIGAILATTLVGLVAATAGGLVIFHRFNVISVAFIPLFVGLGIDFGIQFSVRFRAEQADGAGVREALVATAGGIGRSLTLAAAAIACGFLAFAPTAYVGVSQLGVIAGLGLIVALALNLTLLPALLRLADPATPWRAAGYPRLQRLDAFILGHRQAVVGGGLIAGALCACLIPWLRFDFNPIHLRSRATESVSTLLDLMKDPEQTPNTLEVMSPGLGAARAVAAKLDRLAEVKQTITVESFVPDDQAEKLAAIADAASLLDLTLDPVVVSPPPTDAETAASLDAAAADISSAALAAREPAGPAIRLAGDLKWLAAAAPAQRSLASAAIIPGLDTILDETRAALAAKPVALATLPPEVTRDWLAPNGEARVSVIPKGDSNDNATLARFTRAVLAVAPKATGTPIGIQRGARTVAGAFIEAGVLSFIVITLLLFAVLRRARDVAITMAPIVLTGLLTLGTCVVIGQPLNFANIIALPLLFGIGVAFHIYFVMAWRSGASHLLQSSLTRAVFFSALATATGFGSLWASSHPGTASMGKLLMVSLVWTLVSALIFQPALMGPPEARAERAN